MEKSRSGNHSSFAGATRSRGPTSKPAPGYGASARRAFLKTALLAGLGLPLLDEALGEETPAANERPREGDLFVFAEGEHKGTEIKLGALPLGGPQVLAWPKDPKSGVERDGSRLNQVLLLRLDPASLDGETRTHAADGVVAYSAICTHAQCPVSGWVEDQGKRVLKCFCHNSEYDPTSSAKVIFGPAPRGLPALPLRIDDGVLVAAGTFLTKVGFRPG
jgi:rieske iron-sulfur protein